MNAYRRMNPCPFLSLTVITFLLSVILGGSAVAGDPPRYSVIDLGTLPGYGGSTAFGINNAHQVVGRSSNSSTDHRAFVWLPAPALGFATAGIHDLGVPSSEAREISQAGRIVGTRFDPAYQAFVWQPGVPVQFLSAILVVGRSIRDTSTGFEAVGDITYEEACKFEPCCSLLGLRELTRGFVWSGGGSPTLLAPTGNYSDQNSTANDINDVTPSRVVGASGPCSYAPKCSDTPGTVWDAGSPTELNGGETLNWVGLGVNDVGNVSGSGRFEDCQEEALFWETPSSKPFNLGALDVACETDPGNDYFLETSRANAINNGNTSTQTLQAVGAGYINAFPCTEGIAVLWERSLSGSGDDWTAINLNTQIGDCGEVWTLTEAYDLDDSGWIVGVGSRREPPCGYGGAGPRAFLLKPYVGPCPGDINCTGAVDTDDMLGVINGWGSCAQVCAAGGPCLSDANDDGQVNVDDLLLVINGWGTCP